ncbi:hypothetical protein AAZX31_06G217500 [Glycine max]
MAYLSLNLLVLVQMIGFERPNPFSLKITHVSSFNLKPFESNPIKPFPNWMHRTQQHPSSSMVTCFKIWSLS